MALTLTDEQRDFRDAVRDLCRREAGTCEQRDNLTGHGKHPRNPTSTRRLRSSAGWASRSPRRTVGRAAAWERARGMLPIGGFGVSMITGSVYERFGTHDQKTRFSARSPAAASSRSR